MSVYRLAFFTDSDTRAAILNNALFSDGWCIEKRGWKHIRSCAEHLSSTLVLFDLQGSDTPVVSSPNILPPSHGNHSGPPVLALSRPDLIVSPDDMPDVVDGCIPFLPDPAALRAALHPWKPDDFGLRERLLGTLGRERVDPLFLACRAQLAESLADRAIDRAQAHRLAGLAGTLGFANSAAAWRAFSEGDDSALPIARAAARQAIWTITQGLAETT